MRLADYGILLAPCCGTRKGLGQSARIELNQGARISPRYRLHDVVELVDGVP
jgi:hypothetical protein